VLIAERQRRRALESLNPTRCCLEKNCHDRRAVPFLRSGSPGLVISRGYGRGMPTPSAVPLGFASAFVITSAGQAGPGGPPPVTS